MKFTNWRVWAIGIFATYLVGQPIYHYTEATEIGIRLNLLTREVTRDTPGWNVSAPWILVSHVDIRPTRVCVESTGRGTLNCKLVEFLPDKHREFVMTEGFRYWWWSNRFSFNAGYDREYRGMTDLLRGYAYSDKKFPFVKVVQE